MISYELLGGVGYQDLASVTDRVQSGGPVHRRAEVITVALLGFAGVHTHAHSRQPAPRQRPSHLERTSERVTGSRERNRETIATGREHDTVVVFYCPPNQLIVAG
jgi:hypothetical protein